MRRMIAMRLVPGAVALAVLTTLPASAQTLTAYTDRAAFGAAAGALTTQTFNAFGADTSFQNVPLVVGDFSIVGLGSAQLNRNYIDVSPFMFPTQGTGDGTPFAALLVAAGGGSQVTISFADAITAWGADFGDLSQGNVQRTSITVGGASLIPASTNMTAVRFYGFTSDTPFTSLTFNSTGMNDGFGIDNVSYAFAARAPAAAVPEPSAWAMMIGGFGAIGLGLRRRRGHGRVVPA